MENVVGGDLLIGLRRESTVADRIIAKHGLCRCTRLNCRMLYILGIPDYLGVQRTGGPSLHYSRRIS